MTSEPNPLLADGYAAAAPIYWAAGWPALPMPRGKKFPPPTDYTGYDAEQPSWPDIMAWSEVHPLGNIALHMPDDVIGIDVDAYGDKTGGQTLAHAEELWGALEPTVRSTSRDDPVSGIRFYRVPPGTRLGVKIGFASLGLGHIEIIQASHRYAIVWPSLHPSGERYRWQDDDGFAVDVPRPDDLPMLPKRWIDNLAPGSDVDGLVNVDIAHEIAGLTGGAPSVTVALRVQRAIDEISSPNDSRHDTAVAHVLALLRLSEQNEPGVSTGLLRLQAGFITAVTGDGSRSAAEAAAEFTRMIENKRGHALIRSTPTPSAFDEVSAAELAPERRTDQPDRRDAAPDGSSDDKPPTSHVVGDEDAEFAADEAAFWDSRDSLRAVRDMAYARLASPWSVLGVVLCRALATAPPWVTLPPIIGGKGSLNFFAALVGRSGAGKGISEAVGAELIDLGDIPLNPAGSGEGLSHAYVHREGRDLVRDRTAVMFTVPEVDALTSIAGRQGATIMSKLRSAYSGEEIGFSYADPKKRLLVGAHEYRLTMVIGVQPERAGGILDDTAGGTPQRFVWLPANDRRVGDEPGAEHGYLPIPGTSEWAGYGRSLTVPETVWQTVRQAHIDRTRGEGDALDGHALQTREKVMVALAIIDGRMQPSLADWDLAEVVMDVSNRTRAAIDLERKAATIRDARERGAEMGQTRDAASAAEHEVKIERIERTIERALRKHGPKLTLSAVNRSLASRDRKDTVVITEAIERLVERDVARLDPVGGVLTLIDERR